MEFDKRKARTRLYRISLASLAAVLVTLLVGVSIASATPVPPPAPIIHVKALPAMASDPVTIAGDATSLTQITASATTLYAGEPAEIDATTLEAFRAALPSAAQVKPLSAVLVTTTSGTGPTNQIFAAQRQPGGDSIDLAPTGQGWNAYASWALSFTEPGTYTVPFVVGTGTKDVTFRVIPLPKGATAQARLHYARKTWLQISNGGSVPVPIGAPGFPAVMPVGFKQNVAIPLAPAEFVAHLPPTSGPSGAMIDFAYYGQFGSASFTGAIRTVTHPRPAAPPPWTLIIAVLGLLLLLDLILLWRSLRPRRDQRDATPPAPEA